MNADASNFDPNNVGGGAYYPPDNNPAAQYDAYYGAPHPPQYMSQPIPGGEGAYYDEGQYQYAPNPSVQEYHPGAMPEVQGYDDWNQQQVLLEQQPHPIPNPEMSVAPGCYYPVAPLVPELYGAPVSAVAFNDVSASIHVATHTQSMGHSGERRPVGQQTNRASLLVTHNTTDGMLYSSCAGHPEADSAVLKMLMKTIYNFDPSGSTAPPSTQQRRPPHAYRPPYCGGISDSEIPPYASLLTSTQCQMGIRTLLPFEGYIASVSPSAVRVHTQGGLVVSDQDISGMMCGTPHPSDGGAMTHMTVGGAAWGAYKSQHAHCMDLYQGLRIVSSHGFKTENNDSFAVTSMATNHQKQALVAGCTDGTIRLFDGSWRQRGGLDLARIKSHNGGVTSVSVSDDGHLICTAGYSSRPPANTTTPYAYPDHFVMIYDARFLGRGGVVHSFSGMQGGPRHVAFLPGSKDGDESHSRVLVCSGQSGGGVQIITPFETSNGAPETFLAPSLGPGESITSMALSGPKLALGTSQSNLLQYRMAGYEPTTHAFGNMGSEFVPSGGGGLSSQMASGAATAVTDSDPDQREPLITPPYDPAIPPLSIDPRILLRENGPNKAAFSAYTLQAEPTLTPLGTGGRHHHNSFGPLSKKALLAAPKRNVSSAVMDAARTAENDYLATVPTSDLKLNLLENEEDNPGEMESLPNPNKLLHSEKLVPICYDIDVDAKKSKWGERQKGSWNDGAAAMPGDVDEEGEIPSRYALTVRPTHIGASYFDHAQHNNTGLWPGWEYPHSMPNSYVPSVLLLVYFVPEIRSAILEAQHDSRLYTLKSSEKAPTLSPELGFLFHQMESMSANALTHPDDRSNPYDSLKAKVGAFVPYNFLTAFTAMPEASALALLDGAPAAVESARRPEAFFRFLLHHLSSDTSTSAELIDSLFGLDFISVNEFISGSGPPSVSSSRALTVDLAIERLPNSEWNASSFREILRYSLCKESRLRAWNKTSKLYETVVQRKIASSLPKILALSCSCSGQRGADDGLSVWRSTDSEHGHFLPEFVKVELEDDGNVVVSELQEDDDQQKSWKSFPGKSRLPTAVSEALAKEGKQTSMVQYRLDAVLSFIHDDLESDEEDQYSGHHVLHCRVPQIYKKRVLRSQLDKATKIAESKSSTAAECEEDQPVQDLTQTSDTNAEVFLKRAEMARDRLREVSSSAEEDWVMFNGYVVTDTIVADARAFHVPFKEPCLVIYREVDDKDEENEAEREQDSPLVLGDVMNTRSIATGRSPRYTFQNDADLPGDGDLIAFDAEFVSVQEEKSILTATGSKITVREPRSTLARMSVIDCQNGKVIIDDYVLPHEPVVDYLTRFSGVVASDLDPKRSPHHLVSMRSAYLKLRLLLQRGCIFVGHGLRQDFFMVNLFVPPSQIIDTVDIFHKDKMRFVSLRFLANHLLGRDMQQDTHDSIEDAGTAYQLYIKALELKKLGTFEQVLNSIYEVGQKSDWKLGVDDA